MNVDLFGEEIKEEYDKFVDKFKPRLTTDDCFTPPAVYDCILAYVREQCNIGESTRVLRPFHPGGDYQREDYSGDCVVIDNPPFSILAKICKHYNAMGVRYFLFAPHLTLFSSKVEATRIVASCEIVYQNGARVRTSFMSNMFGDIAVIGDPVYNQMVKQIQKRSKAQPVKYKYPENVITVNRLAKLVEKGGTFELRKDQAQRISALDFQRMKHKSIFGSGYLISSAKEKELSDKEIEIYELEVELKKRERFIEPRIFWQLSDRELDIINLLND